jgi:hypothetical protein
MVEMVEYSADILLSRRFSASALPKSPLLRVATSLPAAIKTVSSTLLLTDKVLRVASLPA